MGLVVVAVVVMGGMYVCLWGRRSVANGYGCGTSHQQNQNCLRNKTTIKQLFDEQLLPHFDQALSRTSTTNISSNVLIN